MDKLTKAKEVLDNYKINKGSTDIENLIPQKSRDINKCESNDIPDKTPPTPISEESKVQLKSDNVSDNASDNVNQTDKKSFNIKALLIVAAISIFFTAFITYSITSANKTDKYANNVTNDSTNNNEPYKENSNYSTSGTGKYYDSNNSLQDDDDNDKPLVHNIEKDNSVTEKTFDYTKDHYNKKFFNNNTYSRDFIIPNSHTKKLSFSTLDNYSIKELYIARNEIFARHGFNFGLENLRSYFDRKSWYLPNPDFNESVLSDIEQHNVNYILATEVVKKAAYKDPTITKDFVIPDSDIRVISPNELTTLTDWEIYVAKNEIYARYGLDFSIRELSAHFRRKSWYRPDSSIENDVLLNHTENMNISTILKEEHKRNAKLIKHDLDDL